MQFSSGYVIYKNKTHLELRIWKRVSSVYLRKHFHCIFWQWECCVLTANRTSSTISVQIVSGNRLLFLAILFRFPCVCVRARMFVYIKKECEVIEIEMLIHGAMAVITYLNTLENNNNGLETCTHESANHWKNRLKWWSVDVVEQRYRFCIYVDIYFIKKQSNEMKWNEMKRRKQKNKRLVTH